MSYSLALYDYGSHLPGSLTSCSSRPNMKMLADKLDLFPKYETAIEAMANQTHALTETYAYLRLSLRKHQVKTAKIVFFIEILRKQFHLALIVFNFRITIGSNYCDLTSFLCSNIKM